MLKFRRFKVALFGILLMVLPLWAGAQDALPTLNPGTSIIPITGEVQVGETISGLFTVEHSSALYALEGRAGDAIQISLTLETTGWLEWPCLILHGPDNSSITSGERVGDRSSVISFIQLPLDGIYRIQLSCDSRGKYILRVMPASVNLITYNQLIHANLNAEEVINLYRFSGQAGDLIFIALFSSYFNIQLDLAPIASPEQNIATVRRSNDNSNDSIEMFPLPETDDYLIKIKRASGIQHVPYVLGLNRLEPIAISYGTAQEVTFTEGVVARLYTFDASVGDVVNISANSGRELDTNLNVSTISIASIVFDDDSGEGYDPEIMRFVPLKTETHFIMIRTANPDDVGIVELILTLDPFLIVDIEPQLLTFDRKHSQRILIFEGKAGEKIRFNVSVVSPMGDLPNITILQGETQLYNGTNQGGASVAVEFTVPHDGRVVVLLSNNMSSVQVFIERLESQ